MSMNQIAEFTTPARRIDESNKRGMQIFCFIYDTIPWTKFMEMIPAAVIVGIGRIDGWTFHINEKGQSNIRVAYMDGNLSGLPASHTVYPAPATSKSHHHRIEADPHTYGWVYTIPRTEDGLLHKILGQGNRVRIIRTATVVVHNAKPTRLLKTPTVVYWDPRHTCDFRYNLIPAGSQAYRDAITALNVMRLAGLSKTGALKIYRHLAGYTEDVEPILIRPSLLPGSEMVVREAANLRGIFPEFDGVEIDWGHPRNRKPAGKAATKKPSRKRSASEVVGMEELVDIPQGLPVEAPEPIAPRSPENAEKYQIALAVRDLFIATQKARGPLVDDQGVNIPALDRVGSVDSGALGEEVEEDEIDPLWSEWMNKPF